MSSSNDSQDNIGGLEIGESLSQIFPLATSDEQHKEFVALYEQLRLHLRIQEPPVTEAFDEDALHALGLYDFVHLNLPSTNNQCRPMIVELISFYVPKYHYSSVRRKVVDVKKTFKKALNLTHNVATEAPPDIAPDVLRTTAHKFMEKYVCSMLKGQRSFKMVNDALSDIQNGLAHRVNFAELIYQLAIKEMGNLISEAMKKRTRTEILQLHKEQKMNSKRKKHIKALERPKKYSW